VLQYIKNVELCPEVELYSFYADVFSLMGSFDLSSGLRLFPSIQSHSRLCITTQMAECYRLKKRSVGDLDPQDPHVFGPPGSGSISYKYGSGSFPFLINVLSRLK
jgi:hypothetical protein